MGKIKTTILLDAARKEEIVIRRKGGDTFTVSLRREAKSPFDVPALKTKATTTDILAAVRESRERPHKRSRRK